MKRFFLFVVVLLIVLAGAWGYYSTQVLPGVQKEMIIANLSANGQNRVTIGGHAASKLGSQTGISNLKVYDDNTDRLIISVDRVLLEGDVFAIASDFRRLPDTVKFMRKYQAWPRYKRIHIEGVDIPSLVDTVPTGAIGEIDITELNILDIPFDELAVDDPGEEAIFAMLDSFSAGTFSISDIFFGAEGLPPVLSLNDFTIVGGEGRLIDEITLRGLEVNDPTSGSIRLAEFEIESLNYKAFLPNSMFDYSEQFGAMLGMKIAGLSFEANGLELFSLASANLSSSDFEEIEGIGMIPTQSRFDIKRLVFDLSPGYADPNIAPYLTALGLKNLAIDMHLVGVADLTDGIAGIDFKLEADHLFHFRHGLSISGMTKEFFKNYIQTLKSMMEGAQVAAAGKTDETVNPVFGSDQLATVMAMIEGVDKGFTDLIDEIGLRNIGFYYRDEGLLKTLKPVMAQSMGVTVAELDEIIRAQTQLMAETTNAQGIVIPNMYEEIETFLLDPQNIMVMVITDPPLTVAEVVESEADPLALMDRLDFSFVTNAPPLESSLPVSP